MHDFGTFASHGYRSFQEGFQNLLSGRFWKEGSATLQLADSEAAQKAQNPETEVPGVPVVLFVAGDSAKHLIHLILFCGFFAVRISKSWGKTSGLRPLSYVLDRFGGLVLWIVQFGAGWDRASKIIQAAISARQMPILKQKAGTAEFESDITRFFPQILPQTMHGQPGMIHTENRAPN